MKKFQRIIAAFTAAATMLSAQGLTQLPAFAANSDALFTCTEFATFDKFGALDNDEMLAGYFDKLIAEGMGGVAQLHSSVEEGFVSFEATNAVFSYGYNSLNDEEKTLYTKLAEQIQKIAAGQSTNAKIVLSDYSLTVPISETSFSLSGTSSAQQTAAQNAFNARISTSKLMLALLYDMPYELYWFDKTKGMGTSYSISVSGSNLVFSNLTFSMSVSSEFGSSYTTTTSKTTAAATAASNALNVVSEFAGDSDYEKLIGYRDYICDAVSYNSSAVSNSSTPYGNPWQLIYVFDGNSSTNVVCEGYSKALQYLCDLSAFDNTECYTVSGTMSGGTGAGAHMWNIVSINGVNFIADVTNSDSGTIGQGGELFLGAATGSVSSGYTVNCSGTNMKFTYDSKMSSIYTTDQLTLSDEAYTPGVPVEKKYPINSTVFPDAAFRSYVTAFDTSGDNKLSVSELAAVTSLAPAGKGIANLKGIELFTEITSLDCSGNSLKTLDVSKNTKLTNLNCGSNALTALNISANTALKTLNCEKNSIAALDLSKNTALTQLSCGSNKLTKLDLSANTALTTLDCSGNCLAMVDLTKNTKISSADCSGNVYNIGSKPTSYSLSTLGIASGKISNVVGAKYDSGANSLSDFDGTEKVTYTYNCGNGVSETFTIAYAVSPLKTLTIKSKPTKLLYSVGDSLDTTGLLVTATYVNGSTANVTDKCVISGFSSATSGNKTISVKYSAGGVTKTATFSVTIKGVSSISLLSSPTKLNYAKGDSLDLSGLKVKVTFSDKTTKEYSASEITSANGFSVTGFNSSTVGTKSVSVGYSYGGKVVATTFKATVLVFATGITLSDTDVVVAAGKSVRVTGAIANANATNKKLIWTSSDTSVATVSSGTIKGVKPGTATVTVKSGDGAITKTISVKVNPAATAVTIYKDGVAVGATGTHYITTNAVGDKLFTLSATVAPTGAYNKVTWTSSSKNFKISDAGEVTYSAAILRATTVTFTATAQDGTRRKNTFRVTFTNQATSMTLSDTSLELVAGKGTKRVTATLNPEAFNKKVTWTSSAPSVATVSNGNIKAISAGTATITVKSVDGGISKTISVKVVPASSSISVFRDGTLVSATDKFDITGKKAGDNLFKLTADVNPDGSYDDVTWKSSSKNFTIDAEGQVKYAIGVTRATTVTFTATTTDGWRKSFAYKVTFDNKATSMTLSADSVELTATKTYVKVTATINPEAFNKKVTWSSADPTIATVSNGTIKGLKEGTTTVTVKSGDGAITKNISVKVLPLVTSVKIFDPDDNDVSNGTMTYTITENRGDRLFTLSAETLPAAASSDVTWKSSTAYFPISQDGTVTYGVKITRPLTVTFTATAKDGSGKKATVKVTFTP